MNDELIDRQADGWMELTLKLVLRSTTTKLKDKIEQKHLTLVLHLSKWRHVNLSNGFQHCHLK